MLKLLFSFQLIVLSSCAQYTQMFPQQNTETYFLYKTIEEKNVDYENFGYSCIENERYWHGTLKEKVLGPYKSRIDCETLGNLDQLREDRKNEVMKKLNSKNFKKFKSAILANKPMVGMTSEALVMAIGTPLDINRTITSNRIMEQFVYTEDRYYYFENGILKAMQE